MSLDSDRKAPATAIVKKNWKAVAVSSWRETSDDNIGLVAAGVAFYGFLALVPLLGAIVLSYGLIASPETVMLNMKHLTSVMPGSSAKLVGEQLMHVVQTSGGKKGLGLLLAIAVALFGARNGAGALITALNIAYEEKETRGFLRVNLLSLGITFAGVIFALVAVVAITALGHLEDLIPAASTFFLIAGKLLSYILLGAAGAAVAATLYRFGPARSQARWQWLTPGSIFSAVTWVLLTLGFGIYVANFSNYNATYGSLSAVIVLLTWLYLSSYLFLFGAEVNSELEKLVNCDAAKRDEHAADLAHAAPGPLRPAVPQLQEAGFGREYLLSRAVSRVAPIVGGRRIGMAASALATYGLNQVRRPGRARQGLATLGIAVALTLMHREQDYTAISSGDEAGG